MLTPEMEIVHREKILSILQGMTEEEDIKVIAEALPIKVLHEALGKKIDEQLEFESRVTGAVNYRGLQ